MTTASTTSLVDALRQYRLLEPVQLEELKSFPGQLSDPKSLAGELIRRKWLTPYQANQLLQGRGQDLVLGSYIVLEKLGEGGMGQVYKARHRTLGRIAALKVIHKERLDNPDAIRRFQREVRAAAALSHPNIVLAYDADQIGGTHLLVMECIEGSTDLARLVKMNGPLPVVQACEYIRQAALGLQHAHERGMVHRDIKPANLLLTADGKTVKVLDMGLARLDRSSLEDDKSSTMTQEGAVMGTPDYIAPEQAMESHTVDIRADLYSLGCTFYFLLTGRAPFPGGSLMEKLLKHRLDEPKPVGSFRADVPPGVVAVACKLMAKKAEDRYQTPAEVVTALASVFSASSSLVSKEERTLAEGAAASETSGDTFASPFDQLAPSGSGEKADSAPRKRQRAEEVRLLLYAVGGFGILLVGLTVLWLLLKPSAMQAKKGNKPGIEVLPGETTGVKVNEKWLREVATMPAEKQVEAVVVKLKDLNPGFDDKVTPKIEGEVVTGLEFITDNVTDISPVRALTGLRSLHCWGTHTNDWLSKGQLSDLSPLKGMKLTTLGCAWTQVSDLSPLKDMRLTFFNCGATQVSDLSPLKDMKLTQLHCFVTPVSDLSPLKDMKLTHLNCSSTKVSDLSPLKDMKLADLRCGYTSVSDLSPLKGMRLTNLYCDNNRAMSDLSPLKGMKLSELGCSYSQVSDLSPLKGMRLTILNCSDTKVSDLSPLKGMPLEFLRCDFKPFRDTEILRSLKTTLRTINDKPAAKFWQEVDAKKP